MAKQKWRVSEAFELVSSRSAEERISLSQSQPSLQEATVALESDAILAPGGGFGSRLFRASGILAAGNILSRSISLLIGIATARLLSRESFGGYGIIQTTVGMFGILGGLALGLAATRYVAMYRSSDPLRSREVAWFVLVAGFISASFTTMILIGLAPWLARGPLRNPELAGPLQLAALQMTLSALFGIGSGILSGLERFGLNSLVNVVQNLVILAATFVLVQRYSLIGAVESQVLGYGTGLALTLWFLRGFLGRFTVGFRVNSRMLIDFCLPTLIGSVVIIPAGWLAQTIIGRQQGGYAQLGLFTAADRFRYLLTFLSSFVGTALFPMLACVSGDEQKVRSQRGLELGLLGTSLLVLPAGAALAFAAPLVMGLFGKSYGLEWPVFLPVLVWGTMSAMGSVVGIALTAAGRMWFQVSQWLTYGILLLAVTYTLRDHGALALAIGHLAALTMLMAWGLLVLKADATLTSRALLLLLASTVWMLAIAVASWYCSAGLRMYIAPVAGVVTLAALWSLAVRPGERAKLMAWVCGAVGRAGSSGAVS